MEESDGDAADRLLEQSAMIADEKNAQSPWPHRRLSTDISDPRGSDGETAGVPRIGTHKLLLRKTRTFCLPSNENRSRRALPARAPLATRRPAWALAVCACVLRKATVDPLSNG
jgi:hypothetical protein